MQDVGYGFPRISLLGNTMNKGNRESLRPTEEPGSASGRKLLVVAVTTSRYP